MKDVKYMFFLSGYTSSIFQGFESFLRTEVDLVEHDIKLFLDEYKSSFITYENSPGIYTFKDTSEFLLSFPHPEYDGHYNAIDIELDDINKKTKLVVRTGIIAIKFEEKSFFSTVLGFTPGWHYKHYIEYISEKNVNFNTTKKTQLESDVVDGKFQNGLRQPIILVLFQINHPNTKSFANLKQYTTKR